MADGTIRVGQMVSDKSLMWIGFESSSATNTVTPLTTIPLSLYTLDVDDAEWLIKALRKEIRRVRKAKETV